MPPDAPTLPDRLVVDYNRISETVTVNGVVVDDSRVLESVNRVRTRMGWEPLPRLPLSDPHSGCTCIFGRSWAITCLPQQSGDREGVFLAGSDDLGCLVNGYDHVRFYSRERGPNGTLVEAIAEELGGEVRSDGGGRRFAFVDGNQPLMLWMRAFDATLLSHLIAVNDPIPDPVEVGWESADRYLA